MIYEEFTRCALLNIAAHMVSLLYIDNREQISLVISLSRHVLSWFPFTFAIHLSSKALHFSFPLSYPRDLEVC